MVALAGSSMLGACVEEMVEIKPPARPTAQEETASISAVIVASQSGDPGTTALLKTAADAVFTRTFGSLVTEKLIVAQPTPACYIGGCLLTVVYVDRCAELRGEALASSRRTAAIFQWPGPVTRTPPIQTPDGRVTVTWAFFISPKRYDALTKVLRPDEPPPPPVPPCPLAGPRPTGLAPAAAAAKAAPGPSMMETK